MNNDLQRIEDLSNQGFSTDEWEMVCRVYFEEMSIRVAAHDYGISYRKGERLIATAKIKIRKAVPRIIDGTITVTTN